MMNSLLRLLFAAFLILSAGVKSIAQGNAVDSLAKGLGSTARPVSLGDTALTKNNYH